MEQRLKAHRHHRRTVQSYSPGGGNVSSNEGTLAPPGEYDWSCASFGPLESTTQTANRPVQPFLHCSRQEVSIFYNGRPYPPELPLAMGGSGPHVTRFLGFMRAQNPKGTSIGLVFLHSWLQNVPILYNGSSVSPSKLSLPTGDLDPM